MMTKEDQDYELENYYFQEPAQALRSFDKAERYRKYISNAVDEFGLEFVLNIAVEHSGGSLVMGSIEDLKK